MTKPTWPADTPEHEQRQNEVFQNGNCGHHYELERLEKIERFHEQMLSDVREERREYLNKNNLNSKV